MIVYISSSGIILNEREFITLTLRGRLYMASDGYYWRKYNVGSPFIFRLSDTEIYKFHVKVTIVGVQQMDIVLFKEVI